MSEERITAAEGARIHGMSGVNLRALLNRYGVAAVSAGMGNRPALYDAHEVAEMVAEHRAQKERRLTRDRGSNWGNPEYSSRGGLATRRARS